MTKSWGPVHAHPLGSRKEDVPPGSPKELIVIKNRAQPRPQNETTGTVRKVREGEARNDEWHSDVSCMATPAAISVLHAYDLQLPPGYGDTLWCNMFAAWDGLSLELRARLQNLDALHSTSHFDGDEALERLSVKTANWHPVVRTHPQTCREGLYLSGHFVEKFRGMTRNESKVLLKELINKATIPQNIYRHRWQPGDVVIWDNRATMHYALFDYAPGVARTMHAVRTTDTERPFHFMRNSESPAAQACIQQARRQADSITYPGGNTACTPHTDTATYGKSPCLSAESELY